MLLHTVLDDEVDKQPLEEDSLLPSVLSFLSSFPDYLEILVQCTRKTEVRSWGTLFAHLPPPIDLFNESLQKGFLKTAAGYLLVLHTVEELDTCVEQCIDLLQRAKQVQDFELCKELARFLMALDETGDKLREALEHIGLVPNSARSPNGQLAQSLTQLKIPENKVNRQKVVVLNGTSSDPRDSISSRSEESHRASEEKSESQGYISSHSS